MKIELHLFAVLCASAALASGCSSSADNPIGPNDGPATLSQGGSSGVTNTNANTGGVINSSGGTASAPVGGSVGSGGAIPIGGGAGTGGDATTDGGLPAQCQQLICYDIFDCQSVSPFHPQENVACGFTRCIPTAPGVYGGFCGKG